MFDWEIVLMFIVIVAFLVFCVCGAIEFINYLRNQKVLLTGNYMEKVGIDDDTGFVFYCDTKTGYMYICYKGTFELMYHEDGKPILYSEWLTMGGSTDGKE